MIDTAGRNTSMITSRAAWRSLLAAVTGSYLLFESASGLAVYLLPFGTLTQFSNLTHTAIGLLLLAPVVWWIGKHWWSNHRGKLSHYQLFGYVAAGSLLVCLVSGGVVTWQGAAGPRMSLAWHVIHQVSGIGVIMFLTVHLLTVSVRTINNPVSRAAFRQGRAWYYSRSVAGGIALAAICILATVLYRDPATEQEFPPDYNWRFGPERPFAPSLASVRTTNDEQQIIPASIRRQRAIDPRTLSGSAGCGTAGCHSEIYHEWLPSAHRYASMDALFQKVQEFMALETSPEHTRYCAGCHDPISLFAGAKNSGNITLSAQGANEGISCLVCHSIVQTDVQGNGDYAVHTQQRYVWELYDGPPSTVAKFLSDFLIRTAPDAHRRSYSRPLYKTAEFCGACHKQYIDKEVNTDIGKVQGQNQYDSWKNSRWNHEDDPARTVTCRECHMPLTVSYDPARGDPVDGNRTADDGRHRSHTMAGANQYVPVLHNLEGGRRHVDLVEAWLRGETEIPEISQKWTAGPVVRMHIDGPQTIAPGETAAIQIVMNNNKAGHDFPTGPLDMIESWVELTVTDQSGQVLLHRGGLDDREHVADTLAWFKADGFDRRGDPIDRHNLWDLVGAKNKRSLYPGVSDTFETIFQCPSMARGRLKSDDAILGTRIDRLAIEVPANVTGDELRIDALLWYRKANPLFLDRVFGIDAHIRSPRTAITQAYATIRVLDHDEVADE